ncbi:MAG: IPT/TIG domain-containing protein, partial [Candidatus Hydrogenedentales bacterium]
MRHRAILRLGAWLFLVALFAGLTPAWGQTATILVAWKGPVADVPFEGDGASPYTDLQKAVDDATVAATNGGRQVLLLIYEAPDSTPWTVGPLADGGNNLPITINADANIRIIGVPYDPINGGPFDVVLQGNGGAPVITIDGRDNIGDTDQLVIDGIAIQGGTDGVLITGESDNDNDSPFRPTLSRCYIRDNEAAGVRVAGQRGAALTAGELGVENGPLLANCSINSNGAEGVRVGDTLGGAGYYADILHCSILMNTAEGVYVQTGCNARVRNSLVYRNPAGGLVWQTNPVINPDSGTVAGGTDVTITGLNFTEGGSTSVFFGPPNKGGTEATAYGAVSETSIGCTTPASWNGAPGAVDVYIVRGDSHQQIIRSGFTYTAAAVDAPVVSQVLPEWGPVAGGNWVEVYGSGFNPNATIRFGATPATQVVWMASGHVRAKVPSAATPGKVEVFALNGATSSVATPPLDYEYRTVALEGPSITQITPNYYRSLQGSGASGSDDARADIVGFNFASGCIVKIGGIVCPYESMSVVVGRNPLQQIVNVRIPVSQFGGGGSYDVEVVNPDGQRDILPNGFTYYASGVPSIQPEEGQNLAWRKSNFVERTVGGDRVLSGSGFDFNVDVIVDPTPGANFTLLDNVQPTAQREILMPFPPDTGAFTGLTDGLSVVPIEVRNAAAILGNPSTAVDGSATTSIVYAEAAANQTPGAGRAMYFDVNSVSVVTVGAPDLIEMQILNYRDDMRIFVGDVLVTSRTVTVPPDPPLNLSGTIRFDAPTPLPGVFGPVDIRVELPTGITENGTTQTLYEIVENAYSYRRAANDPLAYGVTPRTVPDSQDTDIRVLGANFTGMTTPAGANNTQAVYTRVWLDPDGTFGNADDLNLSTLTDYRVLSVSEIAFTLNLDAFDTLAVIPRDTPVDIVLEQYDGINAVSLTAPPTRLPDAVIFENTDAVPRITLVDPNEAPVSGFNAVTGANFETVITGFDFGPADPIVRIGGVEARIVSYTPGSPDSIRIDVPPAPNGLPGVYDVTVIRSDSQAQGVLHGGFTYYMDGKPVITSIEPNHAFFDPADPDQPDITYVTIRGYNFDDIVRVFFNDPDDEDTGRLFYSVSPTEIVVTLPDFESILQDDDYSSDVASLEVTVQNRTDLAPGDPEGISVTSDPEDFFVYRDTRGNVTPDTPVLEFNDVYFNEPDYLRVQPGVGSISVDPMLDTGGDPPTPGPKDISTQPGGWWLGKLLARDTFTDNPIRDKAGEFTESPYTSFDLESDRRPDDTNGTNIQGTGPQNSGPGLPDIGADELSEDVGNDPSWFYSRTTPNPVGRLDAGDLTLEIGVTGCDGTIDAIIIPQGVDPTNPPADAVIELEGFSLGGGYYLFTNTDPITTVIKDNAPAGQIDATDVLADGHAVVALITSCAGSDSNVGFNYLDLSDFGRIRDQATYGRHFLIDTMPPHVALDLLRYNDNNGDTIPEITADELVFSNGPSVLNDAETSSDANPAIDWHPFPLPPATVAPAGATYTPSTLPTPIDYLGEIVYPKSPDVNGSHIFINTGSYSNNYVTNPPGTNLDLPVRVMFFDPPVVSTEPLTAGALMLGIDYFVDPNAAAPRQVAGFMVNGQPEPD